MHCYKSRIINSHASTPFWILDVLLSNFQNNCNIRANSGICQRRSFFSSRSLKQVVWGSPSEAKGLLFLQSQNDTNHTIYITHNHVVATISIKRANQQYIDYWVGVWWLELTIRYRIQKDSCASAKFNLIFNLKQQIY